MTIMNVPRHLVSSVLAEQCECISRNLGQDFSANPVHNNLPLCLRLPTSKTRVAISLCQSCQSPLPGIEVRECSTGKFKVVSCSFSPRNRFIPSSVSWSVYSRSTTGGHAMASLDIGVPHGCFNCGIILCHKSDFSLISVFSRCSPSSGKQEP